MKNWVVIFWLIFFFPLGLLLMFHFTDWQKKIKYSIVGFYSIVAITLFLTGIWASILLISAVFIFLIGIVMLLYSFFKQTDKRNSLSIIILSVIILFGIWPTINRQLEEEAAIQAEEERQEQLVLAEKKERARQAKLRAELKEKQAEEKRAKERAIEKAIVAIEKVEEKPTELNYDRAMILLSRLSHREKELENRLDEAKIEVDAYEKELEKAEATLEKAEEDENRDSYKKADKRIAALIVPSSSLNGRLGTLDKKITQREEKEKLAAEKAEEERIAAEKAEKKRQKKEEEKRIAAEREAEKKRAEETEKKAAEERPAEDPNENIVYVAPQSGTKYHFSPNCRGLNRANSVKKMDINEAKNSGYTLCGWE